MHARRCFIYLLRAATHVNGIQRMMFCNGAYRLMMIAASFFELPLLMISLRRADLMPPPLSFSAALRAMP